MTAPTDAAARSGDRVTRLLESVVRQHEIELCIRERTTALRAEYPGPDGELVWEMIGLPLVEAVNVECSTTPVAEHYWSYRRDLEARGDLAALGRFHQHVDGIYVYVVSGLTDLSGFQDASAYRIDRTSTRFESESLTWLTIAGLHAFSLGPSARRRLEADLRGSVMQRLGEIATALRTSLYFAPSSHRYARSSEEYACILDLVADRDASLRYFTQGDVDDFLRSYSFDALVRRSGWAELWEDTQSRFLDRGSAEQAFADQVFQGEALAHHASDLRATVERSAHTWIDDDGEIDGDRVQRTMDHIAFDLEAARQFLLARVGSGLAIEGQALDGAFVLHEGIRKLESDGTSPYSCVPAPVAP